MKMANKTNKNKKTVCFSVFGVIDDYDSDDDMINYQTIHTKCDFSTISINECQCHKKEESC